MSHDEYGKMIFSTVLGRRWASNLCHQRCVEMGGVRADLDGVIWSENLTQVEAAVEIEARTYKQIRGAMLDLAFHSAPKKLLVVILAQPQLGSEQKARRHLEHVWKRLTIAGSCGDFRLVVLKGTGSDPMLEQDRTLIMQALAELGINTQSSQATHA
jgi:hypothetical protein